MPALIIEMSYAKSWNYQKKGLGTRLCKAPEGPFPQMSPDPFFSDSELILRAYQKWDADCPTHLLGDLVFAIWDASERRLFCARDILGVRPFYYHVDSKRFIFASDMCGVLAADGVSSDLDLSYVSAHFRSSGNYPHDTHTWYAAIKKLTRGHSMVVDRHRDLERDPRAQEG